MDIVVEPVSEDVPADAEPASPEQPTTEIPDTSARDVVPAAPEQPAPKKRGRPPGSRNKPKIIEQPPPEPEPPEVIEPEPELIEEPPPKVKKPRAPKARAQPKAPAALAPPQVQTPLQVAASMLELLRLEQAERQYRRGQLYKSWVK